VIIQLVRKMSVVCIICQDRLTERPQAARLGEELICCSLTCGHLFHKICVKKWFEGTGGLRLPTGSGTCPSCKSVSPLSSAIRVYPTSDEESREVVQANKNLKDLIADNQRLEAKLKEMSENFKDMSRRFDNESTSHEALKVRFAEVLSKVDEQEDLIRENREMNEALENSVKTALEQKDKEKDEAIQLLARLQIKNIDE